MLRKSAILSLMVFLAHVCVIAQDKPAETNSEKEKKKKEIDERVIELLDQAISGADGLVVSICPADAGACKSGSRENEHIVRSVCAKRFAHYRAAIRAAGLFERRKAGGADSI